MPTADAETKTVGGVSAAAIAVGDEVCDEDAARAQSLALRGAPAGRGDALAVQVEDDVDPVERPAGEPGDVEASLGHIEERVAILRLGADDPVDGMAIGLEALEKRPRDQPVRSAQQDAHRIKRLQFAKERAQTPLLSSPNLRRSPIS